MSWDEPATGQQVRAITRLCIRLKIREPLEELVSNRAEARRIMYGMLTNIKNSAKVKVKEG